MTTKNWSHFTGSAAWSTGGDWTPTGAPTAADGDTAVFDSGTDATYAVTGNGSAEDVTVTGDTVTFTGTINVEDDPSGSILDIKGGGTLTLASAARLDSQAYVEVGSNTDFTAGTLHIVGQSESGGAAIGDGGAGTATVSGSGAKFSTTAYFFVGTGASGSLNVDDGGNASTTGTFDIGSYMGSTAASGSVVVNGTGSTLSASVLVIGQTEQGTLSLQAGATSVGTSTTIDAFGTFLTDDQSSFTGSITLAGGLIDAVPEQGGSAVGTVTLSNTISVTAASALESDGPTLDVTGLLSGSGGFAINSGVVELANASNSLSGTITDYGTLFLANATAAGTAGITFLPRAPGPTDRRGCRGTDRHHHRLLNRRRDRPARSRLRVRNHHRDRDGQHLARHQWFDH